MAFWNRGSDSSLPKDDRGSGSFNQYKYDLIPANIRVTLRLAGSNPHQTELVEIVSSGVSPISTAIGRRNAADERVDAPIEVRLFTGTRVSSAVGLVPRGLESVVDEALSRLEKSGRQVRIPITIVKTRSGLRVDLLIGQTR